MTGSVRGYVTAMVCLFFAVSALAADKIAPEDLLKHHLDSIADATTRSAMKSRVVEGTAAYRILVGGSGEKDGAAFFVSDGQKMQIRLKVDDNGYLGERFIRDGEKTSVSGLTQSKARSDFGRFLEAEDVPMREGLLGGVLTTNWSLFDLGSRNAKLRFDGMKRFNGADAYTVTYQPKKTTDMEITLYFDPQTFRHVGTVYAVSAHAGLGMVLTTNNRNIEAGEAVSARQQETRYRIEERFSDFKTVDGVTLPSHYDLRYQQELQSGSTRLYEWEITTTRLLNNPSVDARNFEIH